VPAPTEEAQSETCHTPGMRWPTDEELDRAASALGAGGLVAFPTETVYGLGADAGDAAAVGRIFTVKGRPPGHPLIVHLGAADQLGEWAATVPPAAHLLADAFWPGPLTIILPRSRRVADAVTGGRATVGLRVPDHPVARALLGRFGGGVAAPSANRFGHVSPTTAEHVRADLGDAVDVILDGGPCTVGVESTIVDLTGPTPEVLRLGAVGVARLAEVIGEALRVDDGRGDARAPGMLAAHYAPAARVEVVAVADVAARAAVVRDEGHAVGVLAPTALADLPDGVVELEPAGEADDYARVLYARLRQADRLGLDVVLAVPPGGSSGTAVAVADRLARAAVGSARGRTATGATSPGEPPAPPH
jgi:L-threonylcarbamoyladenylate synthase